MIQSRGMEIESGPQQTVNSFFNSKSIGKSSNMSIQSLHKQNTISGSNDSYNAPYQYQLIQLQLFLDERNREFITPEKVIEIVQQKLIYLFDEDEYFRSKNIYLLQRHKKYPSKKVGQGYYDQGQFFQFNLISNINAFNLLQKNNAYDFINRLKEKLLMKKILIRNDLYDANQVKIPLVQIAGNFDFYTNQQNQIQDIDEDECEGLRRKTGMKIQKFPKSYLNSNSDFVLTEDASLYSHHQNECMSTAEDRID